MRAVTKGTSATGRPRPGALARPVTGRGAWHLTGWRPTFLMPLLLPFVTVAVAWPGAVVQVALVVPLRWLIGAGAAHRRRRLIVSSWRRLTHWEFWPLWIAYAPVAVYVSWLMVRHRSATLFTAANPAMPAGGVIGESKFAILEGLGDWRRVAASERLDSGLPLEEKRRRVAAFMRTRGLVLPVVLKPDAGQRGSGVIVVRTTDALEAALASCRVDTVVQAYVGGVEFGVFYYRRPSETTGHILSITRKLLPVVEGDGVRTVERLILDDERAVCMARFHLQQQALQLGRVPAAGERVPLGDCGSHCRGALFLDGANLRSAVVTRTFDDIARRFDGFYFGRFDVRAPSVAAFVEGRDITILELNGVTSEATHIYDPHVPVIEAYRVLFEQWRLAFEIGAENRARGIAPTPVRDLLRRAIVYRRDARHHLRPQGSWP